MIRGAALAGSLLGLNAVRTIVLRSRSLVSWCVCSDHRVSLNYTRREEKSTLRFSFAFAAAAAAACVSAVKRTVTKDERV